MTDDMNRAIGKLEGSMTALVTQVKEQTEKSDAGRSRIYSELEALRLDQATTNANLSEAVKTLSTHAETIGEVKRWKERFAGMAFAFGLVWAAFAAAAVYAAKWIAVKIGLS